MADNINFNIDFKLDCWYKNGCNLESPNCQRSCPRYLEMNFLINNCGMVNAHKYLKPLSPQKFEVSTYLRLQEIKDNIVEFVEDGRNLFITSPNVQTGKTSWSLKILYKYFDEIWSGNGFKVRGYFLYVPNFLADMRSFEYKSTAEFKRIDKILKKADVVIWDDITAMELNPLEQNILNQYIDKRIMDDKANIFTGWASLPKKNPKELTYQDITKHINKILTPQIGEKLTNRLLINCEVLSLVGTSRVK